MGGRWRESVRKRENGRKRKTNSEWLNFEVIRFHIIHSSNESWYDVGTYYGGVYRENGSVNVRPTPDVFYILNFDNIARSYGKPGIALISLCDSLKIPFP